MSRQTIIWIIAVVLLVLTALLYRQWDLYRSPPVDTDRQTMMPTSADNPAGMEDTDGVKHSVPLDEIISGGPPKDGIPSIDNPTFESVAQADRYLKDDGFGLSLEVDGAYRYYPYQILVWHEIVNEAFNGESLLVTYCPLCFAGIVFERTLDGEPVEFGTSGKLWNNNLVMYDRKTESYWSQVRGDAIVGSKTGTELERYPATTVQWRAWKDAHPDGEVLSRDTGASRDYTRDPYGNYYEQDSVFFPLSQTDDRLSLKTRIFGVHVGGGDKAYPWDAIQEAGVINDTVGSEPVLIIFDTTEEAARGFVRHVGGQTLTFSASDGMLVDEETGTRWSMNGEAVDGPLTGNALEDVVLEGGFWFSWAAAFPKTELFIR